VRQVGLGDALAAVLDPEPDATSAPSAASRPPSGRALRLSRAFATRFTSAARSRSPSVTRLAASGSSRSRLVSDDAPSSPACAASRTSAGRSTGAASIRSGRAKSSTSPTTRSSRATWVSMSAAASRTSSGRSPELRSVRSEPLMIISGLRTSCAMTVDSRPSAASRSRSDAWRWKRAIESVSVPKLRATSRASSSSQGRPGPMRRARSPVAAISFIASVSAASGRVTVRATAQLSSTLTATAASAATTSALRSVRSGPSASPRERSTSAYGARGSAPSAARATA
jgi:hypothetical protein